MKSKPQKEKKEVKIKQKKINKFYYTSEERYNLLLELSEKGII